MFSGCVRTIYFETLISYFGTPAYYYSGQTSPFSTTSEAESYHRLAHVSGLIPSSSTDEKAVFTRATTEPFALDSYQNLLFSIARFKEYTGEHLKFIPRFPHAFLSKSPETRARERASLKLFAECGTVVIPCRHIYVRSAAANHSPPSALGPPCIFLDFIRSNTYMYTLLLRRCRFLSIQNHRCRLRVQTPPFRTTPPCRPPICFSSLFKPAPTTSAVAATAARPC